MTTSVQLYFFESRLPGKPTSICGVLLFDSSVECVQFKFQENWDMCADEDAAVVLSGYRAHFEQMHEELGSTEFLSKLKSDFHNVISLSEGYALNMPTGELQSYIDALCHLLQVPN